MKTLNEPVRWPHRKCTVGRYPLRYFTKLWNRAVRRAAKRDPESPMPGKYMGWDA